MDITNLYGGMWLPRGLTTAGAFALVVLGALVVWQIGSAMEKRAAAPPDERTAPAQRVELPEFRGS